MKYWTLLFFFFTTLSYSALPPLYQGIKEIEAILQAPELKERLSSSEIIEEIIREDHGYIVLTQKQTLYVKVIPSNKSKIGPKEFDLEFSQEPF